MTQPGDALPVQVLVAGSADGPVLALDEPLSFWGGLDPETGRITDARHPQAGCSVVGTVLFMPSSRGSSSSSSVLAEAIRLGTAPAAIVLGQVDVIVAVGAMVSSELYGRVCPVVVMEPPAYSRAAQSQTLKLEGCGKRPRAYLPRLPQRPPSG